MFTGFRSFESICRVCLGSRKTPLCTSRASFWALFSFSSRSLDCLATGDFRHAIPLSTIYSSEERIRSAISKFRSNCSSFSWPLWRHSALADTSKRNTHPSPLNRLNFLSFSKRKTKQNLEFIFQHRRSIGLLPFSINKQILTTPFPILLVVAKVVSMNEIIACATEVRWRWMRRDGIEWFEFYWRFSIGFCSLGITIISFENLKEFFFWKAFPQSGGWSWSLWASFWSFCSFTPHGKRARSLLFDLLRLFRSDQRVILLVSCVVLIAVFILKLVLGISVIPRLRKFYLSEDGLGVVLRWDDVAIKKAALDLSLELLSILLAILGTLVLIRHIKPRDTPVSAPTAWLYFLFLSFSKKIESATDCGDTISSTSSSREDKNCLCEGSPGYSKKTFSSCITWKRRDEGLMEIRAKCLTNDILLFWMFNSFTLCGV